MGRHTNSLLSLSRTTGAGAITSARPGGYRLSLPAYSFVISLALVMVTVIAPDASALANDREAGSESAAAISQQFEHSGSLTAGVVRDNYTATSAPKAPLVGAPDAGTAQAIAYDMVMARGWDLAEYSCLVALWNRESRWNAYAENPSSGAYGIPQALPGSKMASAGADWRTNPATQIKWGLGYIAARYATPCGAWEHSESHNWY